MNNLNSILIEGNLVRDPQIHATPKGTQVCTFTLASNRFFKQDSGLEREVGFFDVETWAKLAENCHTLGHKGRGVRVVGRLKQNRWSDPEGKPHSRISIVAEHVEFRPNFKKGENAGTGAGQSQAAEKHAAALAESAAGSGNAAETTAEAAAEPEEEFDARQETPLLTGDMHPSVVF